MGGSRHSRNQIRQARLFASELTRLQVVIRMYCLRFEEAVDPNCTLQQLRGKEGIRVRQAYADASADASDSATDSASDLAVIQFETNSDH